MIQVLPRKHAQVCFRSVPTHLLHRTSVYIVELLEGVSITHQTQESKNAGKHPQKCNFHMHCQCLQLKEFQCRLNGKQNLSFTGIGI